MTTVSPKQLNRIIDEGEKLVRRQQLAAQQNKACYLEIQHAFSPFRSRLMRNALSDIVRGLRDLRIDGDRILKITSQPKFYLSENEWYRVIEVKY